MQPEQKIIAEWMERIRQKRGWNWGEWAAKAGIKAATTVSRAVKPDYNSVTTVQVLHALARAADEPSVLDFLSDDLPKGAPVTRLPAASNDDTVEIVSLDLSLSMGPGTLIDDYIEGVPVKFDLTFVQSITRTVSDRLRLVRGIGDSMYPTLNGGDAILIDTTQRALVRQDGIYWVSIYGAAGIKRLRSVGPKRILVVSDNPTIDNYEVDANDVRIEGRAIWFARDL